MAQLRHKIYLWEARGGVCAPSSLSCQLRQETMKKKRWGWLSGPFQSLFHGEDKDFPTPVDCSSSLRIFHLAYEKSLWATTRIWALTVASPQSAPCHFRHTSLQRVRMRSLWMRSPRWIKVPQSPMQAAQRYRAVVGKYVTRTSMLQQRMGGHYGQDTTSHYY